MSAATLGFGTLGNVLVRWRILPLPPSYPKGAARKARSGRFILAHALVQNLALLLGAAGAVAMFAHKCSLGQPHLRSLHSALAAFSLAVWFAAWVLAELQVWRDQLRERRFYYKPRIFWRSGIHRRVGSWAYVAQMLAIAAAVLSSVRSSLGAAGVPLVGFALATLVVLELSARSP